MAPAAVVRITASRRQDDSTLERVIETYADMSPSEALAAFGGSHPEIVTEQAWHLSAVTPGVGPEPERTLMNWERNPDAEVSDGWLSNMAASAGNLERSLNWEPKYCTAAHRFTPCPGCGEALVVREGRWGGFYSCSCGWKTSLGTKRAKSAESATRIVGWCGARLVMRINHLGVPYAGCPACHPDYRAPRVNELVGA